VSTDAKRLTVSQLRKLVNQGQRMSNWLYNIRQENELTERYREEATALLESWDSLRGGDKGLLRTHATTGCS
jgi:hypothetical protein